MLMLKLGKDKDHQTLSSNNCEFLIQRRTLTAKQRGKLHTGVTQATRTPMPKLAMYFMKYGSKKVVLCVLRFTFPWLITCYLQCSLDLTSFPLRLSNHLLPRLCSWALFGPGIHLGSASTQLRPSPSPQIWGSGPLCLSLALFGLGWVQAQPRPMGFSPCPFCLSCSGLSQVLSSLWIFPLIQNYL